MEFDRNRYVAPGVPKIREEFLEYSIGSGESDEENDGYGFLVADIEPDSSPLLWLLERRQNIILGSKPNFREYSLQKIEGYATREYLIEAAMMHEALAFAGNKNAPLSPTTGFPIPSNGLAIEFYKEYLERSQAQPRGSGYLMEDLNRSNPFLYELWI